MPPLLLLHGALGSSAQFKQLTPLLETGFDLHTPDLSGHGGKPFADAGFNMQAFADEIWRWINEQGLEQPNIFGYSMGGYIALLLAAQHPGRIGKIATLSTKFNWTPEGAAKEAAMLNPTKMEEKVPAFAKALEQQHGTEWKTLVTQTATMMTALGDKPLLDAELIAQIQNEVLVAVGDGDQMVTLEETIAAYRQLKNGRLLVLPKTPHPLEKMDQQKIATVITQFFIP